MKKNKIMERVIFLSGVIFCVVFILTQQAYAEQRLLLQQVNSSANTSQAATSNRGRVLISENNGGNANSGRVCVPGSGPAGRAGPMIDPSNTSQAATSNRGRVLISGS